MGLSTDYLNNIEIELKKLQKKQAETPKVSVIVPAYNSEKHLAKCLFSLVNQSLSDIEIIIVNDGSNDDTNKVISLFKENDPRIKT